MGRMVANAALLKLLSCQVLAKPSPAVKPTMLGMFACHWLLAAARSSRSQCRVAALAGINAKNGTRWVAEETLPGWKRSEYR